MTGPARHGGNGGGARTPAALAFAGVLSGCGDGGVPAELQDAVIGTYASIVHASYDDSLAGVRVLRAAIGRFLESPSPETLEDAKAAWLAAREPYGQTEAYRFYGGPIDDADGPEALINAWPLRRGIHRLR